LGFLWFAGGIWLFARIVSDRATGDGALWVHAACVLAAASVASSWPGGRLVASSALAALLVAGLAPREEPRMGIAPIWGGERCSGRFRASSSCAVPFRCWRCSPSGGAFFCRHSASC
jgi:hypothetical protein